MFNLDWDNSQPQVLCHPQYKSLVPKILEGLKPYSLENHFILFSSGTTGGDLKGYALSKEALFTNAKAVNEHFNLSKDDVWGLSLPIYHVGGLSVLARAHLLGNKIIDARGAWLKALDEVTITTVVPTQVYDLVKNGIKPSKNLRYLVVGGDFLSTSLQEKAQDLGWPVVRTFGMSEVSSQLASGNDLKVLPIHEVKTNAEKVLLVKSKSLFTLEFILGEKFKVTLASDLLDQDGFYMTKDRVEINHGTLKHLGRINDEVKISGHLVNLLELKNELSGFLLKHGLYNQMEFSLEDDERKGKKLVLLTLSHNQLTEEISKLIAPVKIDEVRLVNEFNRTDLGKLKKTN